MRHLFFLLAIGIMASCSVGSDLSTTTFQKKRYSRGYYVHHAKDRSVPNGPHDAASAASEGQDQETRSATKAAPPEMAVNSEPEPIQAPRRDRVQPLPLSLAIPARTVAGMKYEERTLILPESAETPEKVGRKPVHWTTIANRHLAPDPVVDQDAFHGVDMETTPEPKRPLHWSTWVASGMMLLGLVGSLGLLFLAWVPAFIGLQTSGPNTAHSGSGLALGLFIISLLSLLVYFALVLALFTFLLGG